MLLGDDPCRTDRSHHYLWEKLVRRSVRVRLTAALAIAASALIAPLALGGAPAAAAPMGDDALVRQLRDASGGHARIDKLEGTGKVRFVGTPAGKAIRRPSGVTASTAPETAARAFLKGYGRLFGVRDTARELKFAKARTGTGGVRTVRFQQVHDGIPVVGGDLVVQLESDNDVVSAYGETTGRPATTTPSITARAASRAAVAKIAKAHKVNESVLRAAAPSLAVYDSRLLGGPGLEVPTLVWRTEVTAVRGHEMRELVLVDAVRGVVALHFDQLAHAKNREVCDNNNVRTATDACSSPVLVEGGSPVGLHADAVNAYNFAGDTYDFFFERFGRDSLDNAGMKLTSVVRYCPPLIPGAPAEFQPPCPFPNAYWNGTHMVYGAGFASADDVVGHELTHGVTDHESHLFYYYQSGAINESLSDVFGEFIDLDNGDGDQRWLLGEDLPAEPGQPNGAIRNMANPPQFGDPDRMRSTHWDNVRSYQDNGGVHGNSGVNNKAAYLIGREPAELAVTFNGQSVTGIGLTKAARIYYDASLMLTSASEYKDLNDILGQACDTAAGAFTDGIVAADCVEVRKALLAVEMHLQPIGRTTSGVFDPRCAAGQSVTPMYSTDFETVPAAGWATTSSVDADNTNLPQPMPTGTWRTNPSQFGRFFHPQNGHPYGANWDPTYATSGTTNVWGDDAHFKVDSTMVRTTGLTATGGTFLQFNHAYGFDADPDGTYDGGIVEYSADGGTWTQVPATWFTNNGYNGTIKKFTGGAALGNARLAGLKAFVADSKGHTTSRINLGNLKGKSVRFRFRLASDWSIGGYGWFIDDVAVYECKPYATSLTIAPSKPKIIAGSSVTVSGKLLHTGTAAGVPGQPVEVWRRPLSPAGAAWTKIGTVLTSSTGSYSHVSKPVVNSEYQARYLGSADYLAAPNSSAPNVLVAPKITATLSKTTMPLGSTSYLSGAVSPSHAGKTVRLQRYYSGAWRSVSGQSKVLSSTSKYRFSIKPGSRGTFKYRVVLAAHADHTTGVSPTKTLKVT